MLMRGLTYKVVFIYIDDFLILSKTFEEHMQHLREVFDRLRAGNLVLKASKCHLAKRSIHYLGFIIEPGQMRIDPDKLSAVKDFPPPNNIKELRRFLGMTSFFRAFFPGYANIAQPLYQLTKKNVVYDWTPDCTKSFEKLKNSLLSADVLALPDPSKPFRLYSDCSGQACGFMVTQMVQGQEKVCSYGGRSLSTTERFYSITDLESTAILFGLRKNISLFRYSKVEIITDHKALKYILEQPNPNGRHARFIAFLSSFDYSITHRSGDSRHMRVPDALSRRGAYDCSTATPPAEDEEWLAGFDVAELINNHEPIIEGPQSETTKKEHNTRTKPPGGLPHISAVTTDDLPIDKLTLIAKQREDKQFKPILDYLLHGELPTNQYEMHKVLSQQANYYITDDVLYHVELFPGHGKRQERCFTQIVIPYSLIDSILDDCHSSLYEGGHLGQSRTLFKLRMKYWWPSITKDAINFVRSCDICAARKNPAKAIRAKITPFPICSMPLQKLAVDVLGPFCEDKQTKCKYILVFVDYMTKYVFLEALSDFKAETCANVFINKILCVHGPCLSLHSDNGANFKSKVFQDMCRIVSVKKTYSTALHPEGSGLVERQMKPICDFLSKHCNDKINNWSSYVPWCQWILNNSPSIDSNGYVTPYFLLHGRYPTSWLEKVIGTSTETRQADHPYTSNIFNNLERARRDAVEVMKERQQQMKDREDSQSNHELLRVGDLVYLYKPSVVPSRKLKKNWVPGFYVAEILSPIHVRLRRKSDGLLLRNRIHINRLKKATIRMHHEEAYIPPLQGADNMEPAILDESEMPPEFLETSSDLQVNEEISDSPSPSTEGLDQQVVSPTTPAPSSEYFEIEKFLRKKYTRGKWFFRVRWMNCDEKQNSWVAFEDLSASCRQYVLDMHMRIATDRCSQRKHFSAPA